jgi:glycosyltransferase involved in cell wall biosynthesis
MRIGLVAPPWLPVPPPAYGGTETVLDTLARGLQAAGHEPVLFTVGSSSVPVPIRWLYADGNRDQMNWTTPELRHVLEAYESLRDCDVIHDHTTAGPIIAERAATVPVAVTNHNRFNELTNPIFAAAPSVAKVAISRSHASFAEGFPVTRVIHHGVDADRFPVGEGAGDGDGEYLLFLGRISPDKGVDRAIALAKRAGVRLKIAAKMAEDGEIRFFEEAVRPHLGDRIVYLGEVGYEEKVALLGGARALLNPIRWPEPFGMVMIEAMACGTPVLASPCGAVPEIVSDGLTGRICGDDDAFVDAIARLDDLSRTACRATVEFHFSARRMTADHVELYSSLLERPNFLSRLAARRSANRVAAGSHLAPAAGLGAG